MILWIDAQLSPQIASWLNETFDIDAKALREARLRDAKDREIFLTARNAGATIMTKDRDFLYLQEQLGTPPQVLWVTCGNTSNLYLRRILQQGESLVEIGDPWQK